MKICGFLDVYIFLSRFQRFRSPKIAGANGNPINSWISKETKVQVDLSIPERSVKSLKGEILSLRRLNVGAKKDSM